MAQDRPEKSRPIYVLNGPNLNLLGTREPDIYGRETLADIETAVRAKAREQGREIVFRQTNREGEIVDWIQEARNAASAVILNAGGYSHTSVAILDAARALAIPLIEVHLSNPFAREIYRRHSFVSEAAKGVICGFGSAGYLLALDALAGM
ncbi:MAG TPA: type II 3-dehydroquinate dehydratase [Rhizomicrobium sp.]|nr:type II 3-dehydroquinate dehydratase [Rhizomicrobium sp.]